jgi:hypothetical protein
MEVFPIKIFRSALQNKLGVEDIKDIYKICAVTTIAVVSPPIFQNKTNLIYQQRLSYFKNKIYGTSYLEDYCS